jgi:hypothetical protein
MAETSLPQIGVNPFPDPILSPVDVEETLSLTLCETHLVCGPCVRCAVEEAKYGKPEVAEPVVELID